MKLSLKVLLVDDHPVIINVYTLAIKTIESKFENLKFEILSAEDCDSALIQIRKAKKTSPLDLVLLDLSLPPSSNSKIISGVDLGLSIKKAFKKVKLIILTSNNNNHQLNNVFKSLNPEGFLIKSEFTHSDLLKAITNVINDTPYYSKTIANLMRKRMINDIVLDETDKTILYHLEKGTKMKDLPRLVNLSLGGIERRKRHLKDVFDTSNKGDKTLITVARRKGFI
ncbi:MAG: response regulator [Algibacter sp.]